MNSESDQTWGSAEAVLLRSVAGLVVVKVRQR